MSSKADLARIEKEGFAILEAFHRKKTRPNPQKSNVPPQYQPQQSHLYQVKPDEIMNCHEVVHYHNGVIVQDFNKKSQAIAP